MRYRYLIMTLLTLAALPHDSWAQGRGRGRDKNRDRDRDVRLVGQPRTLRISREHFPQPGNCRIWYPNVSPGRQPRGVPCQSLRGRVPRGAFVLYRGRAWDTSYDWRLYERRYRGSVPSIILQLIR